MAPPPRRLRPWLAAALLAAGFAPGAGAATISGLSIVRNAANTPNFFDDVGALGSVAQSAVSVLSSSATGFSTRYAAVVGADTGGGGAATFTQNLTANFTVTFTVTAALGEAWTVDVGVARAGSLTLVDDGSGAATATLGAMTGTKGGAGVLAGSLGLAAVGSASNVGASGTSPDVPFAQSGTATITGVGTGAAQIVTMTFSFSASAQTIDSQGGGPQGDEAAVRLGLDSALSSFVADDYPGVGGRTLSADGIVVTGALVPLPVPEPETAALLGLGLGGLAFMGTSRSRE